MGERVAFKVWALIVLVVVSVIAVGCAERRSGLVVEDSTGSPPDGMGTSSDILDESDLVQGGPGKDGIPSIDDPGFVSVAEADGWLADGERVLAIDHMGQRRAYPLQILVWHEIVNDELGGDAVAITYCPLCDSGIAFDRVIDGEAVEFGTSGMLFNSNLVMYDRKTESYWTQIDGRAVIGELSGRTLERIPVEMLTWGSYRDAYPDAEVLSRETGYRRPYGSDPYTGYYTSDEIKFPVEHRNDSIHPKTIVHGIHLENTTHAFLDTDIPPGGSIEEEIDGQQIVVNKDEIGSVTVTVEDEIRAEQRMFWFAWYAFHPDTGVYDGS